MDKINKQILAGISYISTPSKPLISFKKYLRAPTPEFPINKPTSRNYF